MPSCTTCQCRVARLANAELHDLSMPSCTTCQCRVARLVNAELHDLSMPSCTTCQCRVARLVDVELYDLSMSSCTTLSVSGKKKAVCRAFAGMKACGIRPCCLYGGNRRSIVEFDTVEEGDSLVDFFVHDDVFLDEGHFLAVFGDKTFDDGRAFQRTAEFQSLCGVH